MHSDLPIDPLFMVFMFISLTYVIFHFPFSLYGTRLVGRVAFKDPEIHSSTSNHKIYTNVQRMI